MVKPFVFTQTYVCSCQTLFHAFVLFRIVDVIPKQSGARIFFSINNVLSYHIHVAFAKISSQLSDFYFK